MTILIGILNKRGAVIAADSAATMPKDARSIKEHDGEKVVDQLIINDANKIMCLTDSRESPIGVMMAGCPKYHKFYWSDAIRHFRKKKGKDIYNSIDECIKAFVDFAAVIRGSNEIVENKEFSDFDDDRGDADLTFTGFGKNDEYPTIISVHIRFEDGRIIYFKNESKSISDKCPSEIKCFGDPFTVDSLLTGINPEYFDPELRDSLIFKLFKGDKNLIDKYKKNADLLKCLSHGLNWENLSKWKERIKDFELNEMAEYAEMIVELTEMYHILRFIPRWVGGPVDIAVITKEGGFKWIQHKDYYTYAPKNHKSW